MQCNNNGGKDRAPGGTSNFTNTTTFSAQLCFQNLVSNSLKFKQEPVDLLED